MFKPFWLVTAAAASLLFLFAGGCEKKESPPTEKAIAPPASLRLAVVDDPALVEALGKVRGEWRAQSGSELEIHELAAADVARGEKLDADAIIYPLRLLGTFAERKLIRPLNASWLKGDPLEAGDLLISPDSPEFTWDGQPYAVPLGEPVFVVAYNAELFRTFNKEPPRTWDEYQALVELLRENPKMPTPVVEPLADGWAAPLLLARAAAYAKHRDYFSVLFDRETMQPLIAGPPFVKALSKLVEAAKSSNIDLTKCTPANAATLVMQGRAAMAILPRISVDPALRALESLKFAELPGATSAYNLGHAAWEDRAIGEEQRVTLRGICGLAGSVVRGSDRGEAAFSFLAWLAGKRWSGEVLSQSAFAAPFRRSQLEQLALWARGRLDDATTKKYGAVLAEALARREIMLVPRIAGESEYMAALDAAVLAAVNGKQSPQQALDAAAAQWEKITDRLRREKQLEAYRRSMKGVR